MNGRLFSIAFLLLEAFVTAGADDVKYHHFKNKVLAGSSKVIKVLDVPTQGACAILCNAHPNCSHLTLIENQPSKCELYSSINRVDIADVSGKLTFLRGNPSGTMSASWIMQLNMSAASGTGFAYWASAVGSTAANLDITGVSNAQKCFEICQINNKGICWAFNYVPSTTRCIIPDYTQTSFTHAQRQTLVRQTLPEGHFYFYMPTMVAKVTNASIDGLRYTMVKDFLMHLSTNWDNGAMNVILNGIKRFQDCYAICSHSNGNRCRFFSYNEASGMCHIPFDDGTGAAVTSLRQTAHTGTVTYLIGLHTDDITNSFNSNAWTAVNDLVLVDGVAEGQINLYFTGMSNITMCLRMCIKVLVSCQMFSFKESNGQCFIADANFHDDWTYLSPSAGYKGYFLKNTSKAKLITKHIEHSGWNPTTAYSTSGSFHTNIPRADMAETNSYTTNSYLKNQLIDYWASFDTKLTVRIEMMSSAGVLLAWLEHNATGSTSTNWFDKTRYTGSSWIDTSLSTYWAITSNCRTWLIQRQFGGCTNDAGWFAVVTPNCGCVEWDRSSTGPLFLYSPTNTYNVWASTRTPFNVLLVKLIFN